MTFAPHAPVTTRRTWVRELLGLGAAQVGTIAATAVVLQLWRARPRFPFYDAFDVTLESALVKTVLLHGWFTDNAQLGFPTGLNLRDRPNGDAWHYLFVRLFSLGSHNWALATNVLFLGSFVLVAVSAYAALRWLRVRPIVASGGAIVTAMLPYHFARNEMHLMLSDYSAVPLVVALAVAQLSDRPWLRVRGNDAGRLRWLGAIAVMVYVAGTGIYYAVMAAVLLVITGAITSVVRRRAEPALSAFALAGVIAIVLGVQFVPTLVHAAQDGRNHAFDRTLAENEVYSLRPFVLVTPIAGHRIRALGEPARKYATVRYPSERAQALGLVAAAGLVGLLALAATPLVGGRGLRDPGDRALVLLAVTAIGLGVTAGGGTLLAVAGFTEIRAWSRISIFLAFIGVAAAARALDQLLARRRATTTAVLAIVTICTAIAVLDQTSGADTPRYDAVRTEFRVERDFVHDIERTVGKHAAVLQLPYVNFPESPEVVRMVDYSHLRGWLASDTLRWSYGAIKGRPSWQDGQRDLALPEQLRRARGAGFDAVWIDRFGYADGGAQIDRSLAACLGSPIAEQRDHRRALYDLRTEPRC